MNVKRYYILTLQKKINKDFQLELTAIYLHEPKELESAEHFIY